MEALTVALTIVKSLLELFGMPLVHALRGELDQFEAARAAADAAELAKFGPPHGPPTE